MTASSIPATTAALPITLRPARADDAERLFRWRNDPLIVALSSSQSTVQWPEHVEWFANALRSPERRIFIIEDEAEAIGQARFDRRDRQSCLISVYLIGPHVGRKLGPLAIRESCRLIFSTWDTTCVLACVREENTRAQLAFERAGFVPTVNSGCPTLHVGMALERGAAASPPEPSP